MIYARVIVAGLIASMVMGMIEMGYEAIAGEGFWSPITFIAATLLRDLQNVASPVQFQFIPVVLGLMGHMMNSVILGILFVVLVAPRLSGRTALIVGGTFYGLVVFAAMWFIVLPLIDPVMLRLNGLVFTVSHMMWGGVLGLIIGLRETQTGISAQRRPAY